MIAVEDRQTPTLPPLVLHTRPVFDLDDDQFLRFCELNDALQFERDPNGDIIVMFPEGGPSARGSARLTSFFDQWAEKDGTGEVFGSSGGFKLPNGATRGPDVAWVLKSRLDALSDEEWEGFLPLCPDFVLELRSRSDSLAALKRKMEEYRANGARLGWLLDRADRQVFVYRPDMQVECLVDPQILSGEPVLHGFSLDLPRIWAVMERKRR